MIVANLEEWKARSKTLTSAIVKPDVGRWVNGRVIEVLASPELGNAASLATGVSILPAGVSTPWHSHEAEELALVVDGTGIVTIDDEQIRVAAGDFVYTSPNRRHQTIADPDGPMTVLWIYGPAGSESRWLADNPEE
jgi:quercetin dioxygenase-like cupin family protein